MQVDGELNVRTCLTLLGNLGAGLRRIPIRP
jgi:hypothetical protein